MGKANELEVGFEYRSIVGLDASDRSIPWQRGPSTRRTAPGPFSLPCRASIPKASTNTARGSSTRC